MACIWKGDMTITWDVIQLRTILNNLHTWAMRVLRPQLSMYIDQWKFRHLSGMSSQEIINLESTNAENVKHIQGVQSIVNNSAQKRLDDLNIGQPDSSVEQFRLAALLQELFRAEHSKLLQEPQKPVENGSKPFAGIFAGISNKMVEPRAFPQILSYVNANPYSEEFSNAPSLITDSQLSRPPIERSQHVQTRGGSTPSIVVHLGANREQKPSPSNPSLHLRNTDVLRDNDLQSKGYPGQRQRRDSPEPFDSKSSEFELTPKLAKPQPTPNPLYAIKVRNGYRIQVQGKLCLMRVRLPPGHLYDKKEYESVSVDEDWETNSAEEDSESVSADDDREADDEEESEEDRETNDYEPSQSQSTQASDKYS